MPEHSKSSRNNPLFVVLDDALRAHAEQIKIFGGEGGIRDLGLLESALAQPMASFGGEFLHTDIFEMAAAYLFHIVKNHPFVDGNKRAGLAVGLAFLVSNGIELIVESEYLYELTIGIAEGRIQKFEAAGMLRKLYSPHSPHRKVGKKRKP